ncbi:hypothetical protein XELAEV_18035011mg, partial [Xenopus laevis]
METLQTEIQRRRGIRSEETPKVPKPTEILETSLADNTKRQKRRRRKNKSISTSNDAETDVKGGIFNLSSHILTNNQQKVLQKGLTFAPTNKPHGFGLFIDARKFTLKKYFITKNMEIRNYESKNDINEKTKKLKKKSTFIHSQEKGKAIDVYERLILQDLEKLEDGSPRNRKNNLTKGEIIALKELNIPLSKNEKIIIKPDDKGGGIKKNYLTIQYPKLPLFYILSKIHKEPEKTPGRLIISGIDSLTSNLSHFIDAKLQPYVSNLPSYLRDSTQILNIILKIFRVKQ